MFSFNTNDLFFNIYNYKGLKWIKQANYNWINSLILLRLIHPPLLWASYMSYEDYHRFFHI